MGRSITLNYEIQIEFTDKPNVCYIMGAHNVKSILADANRIVELNRDLQSVSAIHIWAQTQTGKNWLKGADYATMDKDGNIEYKTIQYNN